MFLHVYILLTGTFLPLVSASVYPTEPIQETVWSADQPMSVSWIEDWKYPALSDMGPFDISLWRNTNTYLVGLASGVDPMTKTCQVVVPTAVLTQGSKYTLRFTTTRPIDTVIYSADFVITPPMNTTTSTTGMTSGSGALATQTQVQSGTTAGNGPLTTVSATTGSTLSFDCTSTAGPLTPSGVPPPAQAQGQQRTASAGRRSASVDVEKLKFRFVFVIWPVLMGITMAL